MKQKIITPYAPTLVESTRSIGYSFESALADIIDNSISNHAREINIRYDSNIPQYVAIIDNGCGMSLNELEIAMRYGSRNCNENRDSDDLGRFGLGLKMASLSQCRKLTVVTKKDGHINAASWDLDYVIKQGDWALLFYGEEDIKKIKFLDDLQEMPSGTVVIWEKFDKLSGDLSKTDKVFNEKIAIAMDHIALVFHRIINNQDYSKKINIYFENNLVKPIDPFLTSNPATQPLEEYTIILKGNEIKVKPYILPYFSKLTREDQKHLGDNNDLRRNQGFYIYRNKRLIVWGTWLRLIKQYDLHKLARIRVDIPNNLDSLWEIDVKKSTAALPDIIKPELLRIVEKTVQQSEKVYRYHGTVVSTNDNIVHVWNTVEERGNIRYEVNRETALYTHLMNLLGKDEKCYLNSFIKIIEDSFPFEDVYYRYAQAQDKKQTSPLGPSQEEVLKTGKKMLKSLASIEEKNRLLANLDKMDYFLKYPDVIATLREEFENAD